jgi:salicylate hydroxylase
MPHIANSELHEEVSEKWTCKGTVESLIQSYADTAPFWKDVLRQVSCKSVERTSFSDARHAISSGKDIGVWQMRDMDPLKTWVKGRTILIGDAAHPSKSIHMLTVQARPFRYTDFISVLPHQAAGAISAIEDAEALYITLRTATRDTVHECLQRAFRIRFKRTAECQAASRREGILAPPNPQGGEDIFMLWDYPGAERWEAERSDMILPA